MRRLVIVLAVGAALGGGPAAGAQDAPAPADPVVRRLSAAGTAHAAWDDGTVWLARGSGEVVRIDATTTDVRARLEVGGTPVHVAVTPAFVFVSAHLPRVRGRVGPPDQVHVIRRDPEALVVRSIDADTPVGVAPLGADRIAVVGRTIRVVVPETGAIVATLDPGAGTVNGFHCDGRRLCVSKQRPGGLAVFDLEHFERVLDVPGRGWVTGVRIVGDRAFVTTMTPAPGFGVVDLTTGAWSVLPANEGRCLPAVTDAAGQRWALRSAPPTQGLELVQLDAECRAVATTPIPGVTSAWPMLLHVDDTRCVFHTLRQGAFTMRRG